MKIIKHNGTRVKVLTDLMNSMKAKKSAEVGVYRGQFSRALLNRTSTDLYLIDIWRKISIDEYDDGTNSDTSYQYCLDNVAGYEDRAFMLRIRSEQIVDLFPDEFFDFIYIDSNHAYDYVKRDIEMWYPKVREGGIISGHDWLDIDWKSNTEFENLENGKDKMIYHYGRKCGVFGVNPAVTEFIEKSGHELNITNDKFIQSWFVFKKANGYLKKN